MNTEVKTMIEQFCRNTNILKAMTGATHLVYDNNEISFSFRFKLCKKSNHCYIRYNYEQDLYEMIFSKIKGIESITVKEYKNIYCSQMATIFEDFTGLALWLNY